MKMKIKEIGIKSFGEKIDITDPCYEKNTWCRMNGIKIREGEYRCIVYIQENKSKCPVTGKEIESERVSMITIHQGGVPAHKYMKQIGTIGVDAGMAGFFENKPDYTDEQWEEFCEKVREGNAWITDEGFFSESGYGDGCYPVYARYEGRKITALEIRFMED